MMLFRRGWPTYVFVTILALLPTAILLAVSYRQAVARAQVATDDHARRAKRRLDELLLAADTKIDRLLRDTQGAPPEKWREKMDDLVYGDLRFREAGLISPNGDLTLTDRGPVQPPFNVPALERPDPTRRTTHVVGRMKTAVMKEESIVIARVTTGLGSVDLLVQPEVLVDPFESLDLGPTGFLAFSVVETDQFLAGVGALPLKQNTLALDTRSGRIRSVAQSQDDRVRITVETSQSWAMRFWWGDLVYGLPMAILSTIGLLVLAHRLIGPKPGLEADLPFAIERGELEIHYQPVVEMATGRWVGAEALLRWNHPVYGRVRPDLFIPMAEASGLIDPITAWIITKAGEELAPILRQKPTFYLSVNLPPAMLLSGRASKLLDANPVASPLTADRLVFEVTERQLLDGPTDEIVAEMMALTERGIRFSLDDFGTGYSSLSYLHKFRFHVLKIDRSFLPGSHRSAAGMTVLETLIDLGTRLDLQLVAEGVETADQADELTKRDVRYAQGWLYCRAIGIREFRDRFTVEG
jgi:sensor c-di-GMP phosphodiesterase-like protein